MPLIVRQKALLIMAVEHLGIAVIYKRSWKCAPRLPTTVADVLAKQEAFLKMELEGQQSKSFDEALAKPLSEHDMTMSAAISVYRDLKRLTNL